MPTTAYQSAYTGTQIDDAVTSIQTAAFIDTDDGTGGLVETTTALSDLTDVTISSPSNNQGLIYDSTAGKWMNKAIPGGGGGGGEENVIEIVKVNGTALTPDANKAVDVPVPTESTVSGWGFTKNTGTYSKPSGGIPSTDMTTAVQTSLGKADTALQSFTETDPVFTASAAYGISSSDITNWNGKTSNVGTVTGVKMNGTTNSPTNGVVDIGTVITSETSLSKGSTTGAGNAVTDISVSGHTITLTKGSTFLTSETSLSKGTTTGSGNAVTDLSVSGHTITLTKGTTFLTSSDVVTIYSGSSAPSSGTGSNGDIYIQTS